MQLKMFFACFCMFIYSTVDAQSEPDKPLQKLEWLIGSWTFYDEEIHGDYVEAGSRNCRYTMSDNYIVCVSLGRTATVPEREYVWYFNYNDRDKRFEGAGFFANYPRKQLYEISVSEDGHTLEIAYGEWEADSMVWEGGARVIYNGSNQYVWDSMNGEPDPETGAPTVSFRDTVSRVAE